MSQSYYSIKKTEKNLVLADPSSLSEGLRKRLAKRFNVLPSCADYKEMLNYVLQTNDISESALRRSMGLATYAEWADYIGIK